MADKPIAHCSTCDVPLEPTRVSIGSMGQYDHLDDLDWESFTCPTCGQSYQLNQQTGAVQKL
jgi:hypothetical protein